MIKARSTADKTLNDNDKYLTKETTCTGDGDDENKDKEIKKITDDGGTMRNGGNFTFSVQ
jgi:hypothetical protein